MARPVHYAIEMKSLAWAAPRQAMVPGDALTPCQYNGTPKRMVVTSNHRLVTCKRCRKLGNLDAQPVSLAEGHAAVMAEVPGDEPTI